MHIPSGTTAELELVTFREALEAANTPSEEYDIEKWLYAPNFYSEYRYILGTRGKNPLICIGINPSTAKPDDLDNTLKSVERIAHGNGFDSFIMFNVYAQRATDPAQLDFSLCLTLASALSLWSYLIEKQSRRFLPWLCPAPCPVGLVPTQRSLMVPGQVSTCEYFPHGAPVTAPCPVTSGIREAQRGLAPPVNRWSHC